MILIRNGKMILKKSDHCQKIYNIFQEVDPYNLIVAGAPLDEYDAEVAAIIRVLEKEQDLLVIKEKVDQILKDAFGELPDKRKKEELWRCFLKEYSI